MTTIKEHLIRFKNLLVDALKADTEALDTIGMVLGNYLLRYTRKLMRKQLKNSALIILSGIVFGGFSESYALLLTKMPVVFMLIACTLYFKYAPKQLFGKK